MSEQVREKGREIREGGEKRRVGEDTRETTYPEPHLQFSRVFDVEFIQYPRLTLVSITVINLHAWRSVSVIFPSIFKPSSLLLVALCSTD